MIAYQKAFGVFVQKLNELGKVVSFPGTPVLLNHLGSYGFLLKSLRTKNTNCFLDVSRKRKEGSCKHQR